MPAAQCTQLLRTNWCTSNGTAAQSAVMYPVHPSEPQRTYNDSLFNELVTAEFLLTRGDFAFIGTGKQHLIHITNKPQLEFWPIATIH